MLFFEVKNPKFETFVLDNAPVRQLATGFDWVERPLWFGELNWPAVF